jgi:hypothetical protein
VQAELGTVQADEIREASYEERLLGKKPKL